MSFRPSALAYALVVLLVWAACLGVALGRAELFFMAVPLLVPLLQSRPDDARVDEFDLDAEAGPLVEGDELVLSIKARVHGPASPLEVLPALPLALSPPRGQRGAVQMPDANGAIRTSLELRCRSSGVAHLRKVFLRLWDDNGLWVAESGQEGRADVAILPRATLLRVLPEPRETGAPFGIHPAREHGDGTDFADIRPFVPTDRVRRINWPVSLRGRGLHVNEFHAERSATSVLLLDCFADIGRRPDSSLDHCLRLAASLALSALRRHDRVGLIEYGGSVRSLRPGSGPAHHAALLRLLAQASTHPTEFVQDLARMPPRILPWHASIVALTPLADDRFAAMASRLGAQGRDVVLLAVRTDELCAGLMPKRARHGLARRLWSLERGERLRELRRHGVRAVNWSPSLPAEAALAAVRRASRMVSVPW